MRYEKRNRPPAALLPLAILLLLAASLLVAKPQDPFEDDETESPLPPPAPFEDPGVDGDPTPKEDLTTLGEPLLEGTLDPDVATYEFALPEGLAALTPSQTPTPATCEGYANPVAPLGIYGANPHYFTYGGQPLLMVGVSADVGCHLDLEDGNKCRYGSSIGFPRNYLQIFADAKAKGLNKIRLWVALGGDPNPANPPGTPQTNDAAKKARNQPFQAEGTYFRLDIWNKDYFDRLRAVVIEAKKNDLFVEVTFFSPFQGDKPDTKSIWLASNQKARALKPDGITLEQVGFSDMRWFALKTDSTRPDEEKMRTFQRNIIDWTIRWLWCYDNVWWEIANEPERNDANPTLSAQWQQQMIAHVKLAESGYPRLTARRPVAVQPFTQAAANLWKTASAGACSATNWQNCRPDVINGHYTQVKSKAAFPFPATSGENRLDLGAITLVRDYANVQKVLGLNEDNITPFSGSKGTRTFKTDIPPTTPNARQFGLPDPVRAEAWEFLLHGGGAFDHFGYIYNSENGQKVRLQLGKIRAFLTTTLPVFSLVASKPLSTGAGWADFGAYPTATSWDETTLSRKHWAALESQGWQTALTGRKFLGYLSRNTPRCKADTDDFERRVETGTGRVFFSCIGENLAFDAYDGRRRPTARYQEVDLKLHLGSKTGTFVVSWLDPTNPAGMAILQEEITWQPLPEACKGQSPCRITSPKYPYDLVLRIVQK